MESGQQDQPGQQDQQDKQDDALAALLIACQQPAFIRRPGVLCAAAATCKALSQAVQQCSGCHMAVVPPLNAPLPHLESFARWLPKHAALVKSLCTTAQNPPPKGVDGLSWELHLEAAMLLLLLQAVQLAAARPPAVAAAAAAAPASGPPAIAAEGGAVVQQQQHQQQQQQQGPLHLGSFSCYWRGTPELLDALPAHSLTQLTLDLGLSSGWGAHCYDLDGAVASAALARLSSLQQLTLANSYGLCMDPAGCLEGVAGLSQLTLLDLEAVLFDYAVWTGEDTWLHALFCGIVQLRVLRLPASVNDWPSFDFAPMTQLQELTNRRGTSFTEVQFPAQLRQLDFGALMELHQLDAVVQLQQLQGLTCDLWLRDVQLPDVVQLLQPLAQMPALQHLSLTLDNPYMAAAVAAALAQLPQLCELRVGVGHWQMLILRDQWEVIRAGLAAATSLTKLELATSVWPSPAPVVHDWPGEAVEACGALAGLTKLSNLHIRAHLSPGDALALSALTGLTRLVLEDVGEGVGDEAAAAVARSCRQLQHLDLSRCKLDSGACLAEIGTLTQLTELQLRGNAGVTLQGLMQLSRLVQLQRLEVDRQDAQSNLYYE
uniref:Uncharacterized protein n=1 Tax=Tetradesmus obliquus TaxID=3088 RepID=A0A383WJT9_TETOB|eukprot:jgi/Sobl393_1/10370/SZX77727.1